jgi:hypothetical protein
MKDPSRLDDLTVSYDVSPGGWIATEVLSCPPYTVCSLVSQSFEAYARLFHPAYRTVDGRAAEVPWADVARANKRQAHPAMEWASITGEWEFLFNGGQPGLWDEVPSRGSPPPRQAARLAEIFAVHTSTPGKCWFAFWDGWAEPRVPAEGVPKLTVPLRSMLLMSGPLAAAATSITPYPRDQLANLWWPDDRAWCVASDIDLLTTYIGATKECVGAILAADDLEVMLVPPDQRVTWDSDTINPLPHGHPDS